jgi:3-oxoacyl-[acyl-carrier-protein] synthase II
MPRRVVITGLGTVTGLGIGIDPLWDALLAGRSCLAPITRFNPAGFPCRLAGEAKDFSAKDFVPKSYRKAVKVMARDIELAVGAARCAVENAGIITRGSEAGPDTPTTYRPDRMGCHIGAGLIAADAEELGAAFSTAAGPDGEVDLKMWGSTGMDNLTPLWLLKYLPNMLSCHVTIIHGAEGPSNTITCAEASSLLSIGESTRVIQRGHADLCFSGGAESKVNVMGLLRMDLGKRVAHTGDETDGTTFMRPYDPASTGGLLGEGGGILILEEAEGAKARGANAYAEVAGFGAAQSSPWYENGETDEGYRFAVEAALADARVRPDQIDAIVPLATGIPTMDRAEAGALRAVFGDRIGQIDLVTVGPNAGNCMAGEGGIQAAVAAKCLREQRLPARLHAGRPADGLRAERADSRPANLRHVMVCTGALGGQNAAIVLKALQ